MNKNKCLQCSEAKGQGKAVKCSQYEYFAHANCVSISEEVCNLLDSSTNLRWFCDRCSKLENINAALESNKEKLNQLESTDVFRGELNILKNDIKVSFADIVSCGIKGHADDIKAEVKTVQTTINDAKQIKERENNLIMFHLPESDGDRTRKKSDDHTRPLLLKMDSVDIKNMIIKNVSKLQSLDVSLGRIGLNHNLSPEQRKKLRSKIEEARALEASDKGFFIPCKRPGWQMEGGEISGNSETDLGVQLTDANDVGGDDGTGGGGFIGNACGYDNGRGGDTKKYSISNCNVNDFKNYGHISGSDGVGGKDGGGSFIMKDPDALGVVGNDYLDSSLDGNKCLMMKGTGNDLNGNDRYASGGFNDRKKLGSNNVIKGGAVGFNDRKKVGNNNVMKGGAVGRNTAGIENDRTNNNFCVVKIKLGLLNIRSIGSKYNTIYDLISDGLDIFVVTEMAWFIRKSLHCVVHSSWLPLCRLCERSMEIKNLANKTVEEIERRCKIVEKQRDFVAEAFRKQLKLVNLYKNVLVLTETHKMLTLSEDEFQVFVTNSLAGNQTSS
ncbi:hypothetical protein HELRODRAFT_166737 [Helobdella robusta]|uniref:PHD-type domain-containing protein n=1 Tax=Helobdella robusta TaxID=6412 RepID=T1EYG4_HELRO|nr:hypothetical protein HELRODRAFT_166737 [Helobdella robusta]ESO11719.1 hypothetical protein HELRODRAFT_166737 [Helobdella robusta]